MPNSRRRYSESESIKDLQLIETKSKHPVESPMWWVERLYAALSERNEEISIFDDYYRGDFPLPWLAPDAEEEFRRIMRLSRANYCGLIVDSMCERMIVEGFRIDSGVGDRSKRTTPQSSMLPTQHLSETLDVQPENGAMPDDLQSPPKPGSGAFGKMPNVMAGIRPGVIGTTKSNRYMGTSIGEADMDTWRIWQANKMDSLFDQAILEAAINGMSYIMIAPNPKDRKTPHIWVEHPSQCIIEHRPGTQRHETAAGLKVWEDDINDVICATLYLPGEIHKFQAKRKPGGIVSMPKWEPRRIDGEEWPAATSLDFVPIYEIPNNPRMLTGGHSELYDVLDSQDRVCKTIADRLMTQDYGAFPQKWAKAWPLFDENGNPTKRIDIGRDRMITTDVAEADFGQFDAADVMGYMKGKKEDVHDMAARTRTPAQYLLGEFSNVNGETLKASESGLVSKIRQRIRGIDDVLECVIRDVRSLAGISTPDDVTMEIVWRNPEFKTEGELVDSLQKMSTLGVPPPALWERWGASQQEISRWQEMERERAQAAAEADAQMLYADTFRRNNQALEEKAGNVRVDEPGATTER